MTHKICGVQTLLKAPVKPGQFARAANRVRGEAERCPSNEAKAFPGKGFAMA